MASKCLICGFAARGPFGGGPRAFPPAVAPLIMGTGSFAVKWALFWFLKRPKVFLKV